MRNTHHTFGPDDLYAYCLDPVREPMRSALPSLDTWGLLWTNTVAQAHAMETASRALSANGSSDPIEVAESVGALLMSPTPARLYDMWHAWDTEHGEWPLIDTLRVPIYFLSCQMTWVEGRKEVARRGRKLQLPVFKAFAGLTAGPPQPDTVRIHRFIGAMNNTLWSTVRRRLNLSREINPDGASTVLSDAESVMLAAVAERESRGRAGIVEFLSRERVITTDNGLEGDAYAIPPLPLLGMQNVNDMDAIWRTTAKESALKSLARIAPGILGLLETTLPDAAHAAQRAENDLASAKKRGGSGGRKAEKAMTDEIPVQHVPLGDPTTDAGCIDPGSLADDRHNPEQELEAREDEIESHKCAIRVLDVAIKRWGESGKIMYKEIAAGETYRAAAEAAGITERTVTNRLATLKKLHKN